MTRAYRINVAAGMAWRKRKQQHRISAWRQQQAVVAQSSEKKSISMAENGIFQRISA